MGGYIDDKVLTLLHLYYLQGELSCHQSPCHVQEGLLVDLNLNHLRPEPERKTETKRERQKERKKERKKEISIGRENR